MYVLEQPSRSSLKLSEFLFGYVFLGDVAHPLHEYLQNSES